MTQPEKTHAEEGEGLPASAIPGAWARPAAAFVDETTVVRPERRAGGSRAASLVVLGLLAVGAAVFAWGVTLALNDVDEVNPTGPVEPKRAAASATSAPTAPPVPDGDPSFPSLPDGKAGEASEPRADAREPVAHDEVAHAENVDELDVDIPAPKLIRLARTSASKGELDKAKKRSKNARGEQKRYARQTKGQSARGKARANEGATPRATATATSAEAASSAKGDVPAPRPTAASLTREAEKLYAAGDLDEARDVVERALELSPGYPRAHRALGIICAKQGDTPCARGGYETYLRLAPDAPDAPDVRRILGM